MAELVNPRHGGFFRAFGAAIFIRDFLAGEGAKYGVAAIDPDVGAPQEDIHSSYKLAIHMTTAPLYRETVAIAERIQPSVLPEDVKTGKYVTYYPPLAIEVSKIRTQFDKRLMKRAGEPVTLEEARDVFLSG